MEIEEAKKMKQEMENQVLRAITCFIEKTGLQVTSVFINEKGTVKLYGERHCIYQVDIPVNL